MKKRTPCWLVSNKVGKEVMAQHNIIGIVEEKESAEKRAHRGNEVRFSLHCVSSVLFLKTKTVL